MANAYQQALGALNAAQRQAVETTDGPVLVIAGPGTGKTQLLTTRIAHILATTDTLPQNILCLTFTDSAAQTMRQRLSNMIGQAAYDVTISTYHAFGADLIRRFPDYFSEDAELQPVDDLGIDRILRAIIASLPYSNPLKYADNYLPDIKTLISDAKRALLTPADLRAISKQNLTFIVTGSPIVSEVLGKITRLSKKDIPLFATLAGHLAEIIQETSRKRSRKVADETLGSADAAPRVSGLLNNFSEMSSTNTIQQIAELFLTELRDALSQAEESGKTTPLTAWKNKWLAKDEHGKFIIDGAKANQKIEAAANIYQQYLDALGAEGLYDYDDMILRAARTLQHNPDLRYTLQEQYLYILLDEFQDTNGAQLRLVQLLTDNPVSEGRPNVLAVGDDDQAIYAFQGANYSHMLQFKDMYRDVLPVPLTENYRSDSGILHTARGIAEQIEERLHHHFPQIEKTLVARASNLPRPVIVERREAQSDVMQFAWVAATIKKLLKEGMPPSEIAVLAPQHKYLVPLVPFLQQHGVPVRYEKRENVLEDPAIVELLRMSELVLALQTGNQAVANALWAQVLSFAFWQLPTSTIWRLSWQSQNNDDNWTDGLLADENLKPIALFFIRLSLLAGTETLETMLDHLIGSLPLDLQEPGYADFTSPYYTHYFGDITPDSEAGFWNVLSNLTVLRARLRDYQKDGSQRLSLTDFIQFTEAMQAANLKILNTSPYASAADAVQLATAFKAKGMEWTVVFVLAVNDEAWGGKSHAASARISLPPNLQFIRYAGATNDERLRLFYVAVSRAKSQLYLLNYMSNYAGKAMTRLRFLNETAEQNAVQSPLLPESSQAVLPAEDGTPTPTTELAAYWSRRHEEALQQPDMRALLQDRLRGYQLSPTHLNDFTDISNCGPRTFFLKTILRFPAAPRPEMQFGSAMHETLEWLHHSVARDGGLLPTSEQIAKTFTKRLESKNLSKDDTELFIARGTAALAAYVQQRANSLSPDNVVEYNFRSEGVFAGLAHLTGKIDKLVVDRQQKTVHIVDFKTGRSHSRWSRELRLHKYRQQLYFYKALVEGSHSYAGYTVTGASLEFVEPDENGRIQELQLVFDEAEFKRVKRLAEAVWQRITTLELPDAGAYSGDMQGVEAFEKELLDE